MKLFFFLLLCSFTVIQTEENDSKYEDFKPLLQKVGLEKLYPKIVEQMKKRGYNENGMNGSVLDEIALINQKVNDLLTLTKQHKNTISTQVETLVKMIINKLKPDFKALNYDVTVLKKNFNLTENEVVKYKEIYSIANLNFKKLELYLYKDTPLC